MNSFKWLFALIGISMLGISCNRDTKHEFSYFLIQVDSIHAPDSVQLANKFTLRFFGTIGENSAFSFDKFDLQQHDNKATIRAIGKQHTGKASLQPTTTFYLDNQSIELKADTIGDFYIEIENPGLNQLLKKTVIVSP